MSQEFTHNVLLAQTDFDTNLKEEFNRNVVPYLAKMTPYPISEGSNKREYIIFGESSDAREVTERFGVTDYEELSSRKRTLNRTKRDVPAVPITEQELREDAKGIAQHSMREQSKALKRQMNLTFFKNFEASVQEEATVDASGDAVAATVAFKEANIIRADYTKAAPEYGSDYTTGYATADAKGLTLDKLDALNLLLAQNNLIGDDVMTEMAQVCMVVTEAHLQGLLDEVRATSSDYSIFFQYDAMGNLRRYRNIEFLRTEFVGGIKDVVEFSDGDSGTVQKLYAWHPDAFVYDMQEPTAFYTPPGAGGLATRKYEGQVYAYNYFNTKRVREEAAFRIDVIK